MKLAHLLAAAFIASSLVASSVWAGDTYQVTGPVVSVTDTTIVVQKGDEKWEIARDASTQVKGGEIKAGAKITVKYRMTAVTVEVKDAKK
jgi:hypothetical protein